MALLKCIQCGEAIPRQPLDEVREIHDCLNGTRYQGRRFCSIACRSDFVAADLVDDYEANAAMWAACGLWDSPKSSLRA